MPLLSASDAIYTLEMIRLVLPAVAASNPCDVRVDGAPTCVLPNEKEPSACRSTSQSPWAVQSSSPSPGIAATRD